MKTFFHSCITCFHERFRSRKYRGLINEELLRNVLHSTSPDEVPAEIPSAARTIGHDFPEGPWRAKVNECVGHCKDLMRDNVVAHLKQFRARLDHLRSEMTRLRRQHDDGVQELELLEASPLDARQEPLLNDATPGLEAGLTYALMNKKLRHRRYSIAIMVAAAVVCASSEGALIWGSFSPIFAGSALPAITLHAQPLVIAAAFLLAGHCLCVSPSVLMRIIAGTVLLGGSSAVAVLRMGIINGEPLTLTLTQACLGLIFMMCSFALAILTARFIVAAALHYTAYEEIKDNSAEDIFEATIAHRSHRRFSREHGQFQRNTERLRTQRIRLLRKQLPQIERQLQRTISELHRLVRIMLPTIRRSARPEITTTARQCAQLFIASRTRKEQNE